MENKNNEYKNQESKGTENCSSTEPGSCSSDPGSDSKKEMNAKQVYEELQKIDWTPIEYKVKKEMNSILLFLNPKSIEEQMDEFKKFYSLCVTGNGAYVPSEPIDVVWHQFVLNMPFNQKISTMFGVEINHVPRVSDEKVVLSKMKESFKETINYYKECFGEPNSKIWRLKKNGDCKSDGNCGGSSSRCESNSLVIKK